MEWSPTFVVAAINVCPVLYKEFHHLQVVIDTSLKKQKKNIGLNNILQLEKA
jgi:hypothetical protein